jgi:hypothetical protein
MGSRAQVKIQDTGVYLYTHWDANTLVDTVYRAIARQERWGDPSYLARIIFCEMVKGDIAGAVGYAIDTAENGDNELLIVVSCHKRTVEVIEYDAVYSEIEEDAVYSEIEEGYVNQATKRTSISFDDIARPILSGFPEAVGTWI